jgi:tetratricopeptide (TPR) repeat protein
MRPTTILVLILAVTTGPRLGAAQSAPRFIARGDSLYHDLKPQPALAEFQAAIQADPASYEALWKAARSASDMAKILPGDNDYSVRIRDSLYLAARDLAERAIKADSTGADAHFILAADLGRYSRTRGGRERVRFAKIIYDEAAKALKADSLHDGAHHVIGAWHAEVRRLSGIQRFFAKALFGAGFMDIAAWDSATTHLERAVQLRPQHVFHRLELARVYVDLHRWADARAMLEAIPALPIGDVQDGQYKREAAELLGEIRNKK